MFVSEVVSKLVYTVLSVILYITWLTIIALCGSYDVLAPKYESYYRVGSPSLLFGNYLV